MGISFNGYEYNWIELKSNACELRAPFFFSASSLLVMVWWNYFIHSMVNENCIWNYHGTLIEILNLRVSATIEHGLEAHIHLHEYSVRFSLIAWLKYWLCNNNSYIFSYKRVYIVQLAIKCLSNGMFAVKDSSATLKIDRDGKTHYYNLYFFIAQKKSIFYRARYVNDTIALKAIQKIRIAFTQNLRKNSIDFWCSWGNADGVWGRYSI